MTVFLGREVDNIRRLYRLQNASAFISEENNNE
jgi:hypothetical protein